MVPFSSRGFDAWPIHVYMRCILKICMCVRQKRQRKNQSFFEFFGFLSFRVPFALFRCLLRQRLFSVWGHPLTTFATSITRQDLRNRPTKKTTAIKQSNCTTSIVRRRNQPSRYRMSQSKVSQTDVDGRGFPRFPNTRIVCILIYHCQLIVYALLFETAN